MSDPLTTDKSDQTERTFNHHLAAFAEGIDSILGDYDDASVILTPDGSYVGLAQIRKFFEAFLNRSSKDFWDVFKITKQAVVGPVAYLTWSAKPFVPMATDTLWVVNGKIAVQTFTPFSP